MDLEPWEALDVDDSDLSAFLRPCNSNSDSSSLIPGPAGAVQAVMRNRRRHNPIPTQEFIRQVDRDFKTNPWLCALQFLGGMVDDVAQSTPLSSIMNNNAERVALVVGFVKSSTPNGFGDITVTLKDPTATVTATVHRKVLVLQKDIITVGSVLILQKVAVFSPNRSNGTRYLNITLHNILKVFSKDSGPPSQTLMERTQGISDDVLASTSLDNVEVNCGGQGGDTCTTFPHWTEEQLDELLAFDCV